MRAWRDDEPPGPPEGDTDDHGGWTKVTPERPPEPDRSGMPHAHGDVVHAHDHPHGHDDADEEGHPAVAIVGAGPVGTALGVAISAGGWPVVAVASRSRERRERFRALVPDAHPFSTAGAVLDEASLIVLAVPDDAVRSVASELRLYGGQALVHTSGVLGAEALEGARAAGAQLGAFHPLVAFTADVDRSVAALRGATVAVDGDEPLVGLLADLAEAIGAVPVRLVQGGRPAYHAAAVLAAGGFVALLDAIAELGAAAGLDERGSLAVYGRLIEQTLANARSNGISSALTGPIVRGDVGTIRAHLAAVRSLAPGALELYLAAARREVELATQRGALAPEQAEAVRASLAKTA